MTISPLSESRISPNSPQLHGHFNFASDGPDCQLFRFIKKNSLKFLRVLNEADSVNLKQRTRNNFDHAAGPND